MDGSPETFRLRSAEQRRQISEWNDVAAGFDAEKRKRERRELLKSIGLIAAVPTMASGWAAWAFSPRIEYVPSFIPVRDDGSIAHAYKLEDLPQEAQNDIVALNTLWQYVVAREAYAYNTATMAWNLVSAMSTQSVREEYQKAANPSNPNSPYQKYGKTGSVRVDTDSHFDLPPPEGYKGPPPAYGFRFFRTEDLGNGMPPTKSLYGVTLNLKRGVLGYTPRFISESNALSIQVTSYSGSSPVGAPRQGRPRQ